MAVQNEGNQVSYTYAGLTLDVLMATIPGWEKQEIDMTTLSNTEAKTAIAAALKKYGNLILVLEFDPAEYDSSGIPTANAAFVITFPDSSNITFWCEVISVSEVSLENDNRPQYTVNFLITNRNGSGVETPPAYSAT